MKNSEKNDTSTESINPEAIRQFFEDYKGEYMGYLTRQAGEFEKQFQDTENIRISDVLGKLGFQEISFEDLEPELQEALNRAVNIRWLGHPLKTNGDHVRKEVIFKHPKDQIFYFFGKNGSIKTYKWSRLSRNNGAYYVEEVGDGSNIKEIIPILAYLEIVRNETQKICDRPLEADMGIRLEVPKAPEIAEETREQIGEL